MTLLCRSCWRVWTMKVTWCNMLKISGHIDRPKNDTNQNKSKEMVLGSLAKQSIPCLTIQSDRDVIDRVITFKLFGVTLWSDLSWEANISVVCTKVAPWLHETVETHWVIRSDDLLFFLFAGNKTCHRIWMCILAPWFNCCTIPKTGVLVEEGFENHPPCCIWYAVWFCVCIWWSTTPLCSEDWIMEEGLSLGHNIWQLFTWPSKASSPTTRFRNSFLALTTHYLSNPTNRVLYRSFIHYALAKYQ